MRGAAQAASPSPSARPPSPCPHGCNRRSRGCSGPARPRTGATGPASERTHTGTAGWGAAAAPTPHRPPPPVAASRPAPAAPLRQPLRAGEGGGARHGGGGGLRPSAANGKPPAAALQPIAARKAAARLSPAGCGEVPAALPPATQLVALCDSLPSSSSRRVALRHPAFPPLPITGAPVSGPGRRGAGPPRPIGAESATVTEGGGGAVARALP